MMKKKERQYLEIDITDPQDKKYKVNVDGIKNQQIMIDCLAEVISQMLDKSREFNSLIGYYIEKFEDNAEGNAEDTLKSLKIMVKEMQKML